MEIVLVYPYSVKDFLDVMLFDVITPRRRG